MSFRKSFFKNLLISGGYNYASQGILFLSTVVTSRILEPKSFGFVGLITVFTGFISIFSDSGISLAIIKSDYRRTYHKGVDNLAFFIGLSLCIITCVIAYPISKFYDNNDLFLPTLVLSLLFLLKSMSLVRGALLSKDLKFGTLGKVTLLSTLVQVVLTIVLAYQKLNYWALIIPQIISSLITLMVYESLVKLGFRLYPLPYLKVAFKYTRKTIGNLMGFNIINYWARNTDNLIVGKIYGINDLGIYNRAYNLLTLPLSLITGLIGGVLFPSLKKLKSSGGDINDEYMFILKFISIISLPLSTIMILLPTKIVLILWGSAWIKVSNLLPYFGLLLFSQSLLSTAGNILVLFEKEKTLMISGWVGAITMICGICYGAFSSIEAIAQFYSLSFIAVVLPFNVYFIFFRALRIDSTIIYFFWIPVIVISLGIWLSCFFNLNELKVFFLCLLYMLVIYSFKDILMEIVGKFLKGHKLSFATKRA